MKYYAWCYHCKAVREIEPKFKFRLILNGVENSYVDFVCLTCDYAMCHLDSEITEEDDEK